MVHKSCMDRLCKVAISIIYVMETLNQKLNLIICRLSSLQISTKFCSVRNLSIHPTTVNYFADLRSEPVSSHSFFMGTIILSPLKIIHPDCPVYLLPGSLVREQSDLTLSLFEACLNQLLLQELHLWHPQSSTY